MATNLTITTPPKMFGAYVTSISSSVGYGSQSSTLQLSVVEDPPKGVEISLPEVGTACQFTFKGFSFAGIFQRYTKKQGSGGTNYDLIFESPSKVLDGIQVVLDQWEGTVFNGNNPFFTAVSAPNFTSQLNNVWNVFAVKENYALGGTFGGSDVNSAGFPAKEALRAMEKMSRGEYIYPEPETQPEDVPFGQWTPPVYPDPQSSLNDDEEEIVGGAAHFGDSTFEIDFGELIDKIPDFYRLKGPVSNVQTILQECCDLIVHDYIILIDPDTTQSVNGEMSGRQKIIIKLIDKSQAPNPGVVESLVESYKSSGKLISCDNGKELANATTQKLILGGPANRHWEIPMNYLIPVWGKDQLGNYSLGRAGINGYDMDQEIQVFLDDGRRYLANILELRAAATSKECWELCVQILKPFTNYPGNFSSIGLSNNMLNGLAEGRLHPAMMANTNGAVAANLASQSVGVNLMHGPTKEMVWSAMETCASEFWGQQFMVPLPVEPGGISQNIKFTSEDLAYVTAWDMAESAWNERFPAKDILSYDKDGKMKNVAAYFITPQRDYGNLNGEQFTYWTEDGYKTIGSNNVEVGDEILWLDNSGYEDPDNPFDDVTAMVHIKVPQVVTYDSLYSETDGATKLLLGCFANLSMNSPAGGPVNIAPAGRAGQNCEGADNPWFNSINARGGQRSNIMALGLGFNAAFTQLYPKAVRPWSVSLAQQSNRYSWGPWYLFSQKNGKAEVSLESSLVPSTFGSIKKMDEAGFTLAYAGTANLYASETGYVEVAEFPDWNIADRFAGSGPYVTNIDVSIGTSGCKTNYKFNTWTRDFGKIAKYNIDRISRINKNTIRFLQEQRNKWGNLPTMANNVKLKRRRSANGLEKNRNTVGGMFGNFIPLGANQNLGAAAQAQPDRIQYTSAIMQDLSNPQTSMGTMYDGNFGCSAEQIFTPLVIDKFLAPEVQTGPEVTEGTKLPGFRTSSEMVNFDGTANNSGQFEQGQTGPCNRDLDPYFKFSENDFQVVVHNNAQDLPHLDLNVKKDNEVSNPDGFKFFAGLVSQVRTFGLRGPLMISGWGYDICDLPVPSKGQGEKYEAGDEIAGLPIDPNWVGKYKWSPEIPAMNRGDWKTGPVSLMWDEERQVWAGGLQIVEGVVTSNITKPADPTKPTKFTATIRRQIKDQDTGENKEWKDLDEEITIINRDPTLELDIAGAATDLYVMAIRINYEWRPLWVSCETS